jgi:flagellin
VLLGLGDGTFAARVSYSVETMPYSIVTGDFTGDGVLDLVSSGYSGSATLLLGRSKDGVAPLLPFSLSTLADARQALPVFKRKREQLEVQRGEIGAFQSRIDVARNVLEVSSENFRAAESRIRDADIADESSRLVRLNILQQAAASVLAQANQQPALVLQLLSG